MKRIAIIVSDPKSGVLYYPVKLAVALTNLGHEVTAIKSDTNKEQNPGLLNELRESSKSVIIIKNLKEQASLSNLFKCIIKKFSHHRSFLNFDCVLSTGPYVTLQLRLSNVKGKFITSVNAMGHDGESKIKEFLGKILLNLFSDKVVALCQQDYQRLILLGVNIHKLKIVYNPINIKELKERSKNFGKDCLDKINGFSFDKKFKYISYLASFQKRKQHSSLIDIFYKINNHFNDLFLVLAGDGPELENCKKKVESLGLAKKIIFLGRIDNDKAICIIKNASLIVHCSKKETFGYSMVEPLIIGTPIIMSRVGIGYELEKAKIVKAYDPENFNELYMLIYNFFSSSINFKKSDYNDRFLYDNFSINLIAQKLIDS